MDWPEPQVHIERRATSQTPEVRFMRLKDVLETCGLSKSSIYDAIKKGEFPKPVRLYGRTSAWIKSEVLQWAQSRINASRPE